LKELALDIGKKGFKMETISEWENPVNLVIPKIESIKSEIDYREYAMKNGYEYPFNMDADFSGFDQR
jgi:hypothetical protein